MVLKRNPWIGIADLLSSVVLVLLLLFIMASIGPKYTKEAQRQDMMQQINTALNDYESKGQIRVHRDKGILEFTSVTFPSGSAQLNENTEPMIKDLAFRLKQYMTEHSSMEILIEGHTDPDVVSEVVNRGGYFADNIQLSTLRAANVRSALLNYLGKEYANRIGVAGYGDTRLKNAADPLSAENRRIEIRILWNGQENK